MSPLPNSKDLADEDLIENKNPNDDRWIWGRIDGISQYYAYIRIGQDDNSRILFKRNDKSIQFKISYV